MKIVFATPEALPFAKTGGLADVCRALPRALAKSGHQIDIIMPAYRAVFQTGMAVKKTGLTFDIDIGDWSFNGELYEYTDGPAGLRFYFIGNDFLYDRAAYYVDPKTNRDYSDNDDRFIFFSRAVFEAVRLLGLRPDIIHAHDWQSAPVIAYLKTGLVDRDLPAGVKTVFTIHNMGYQGVFPMTVIPKLGIDEKYTVPLGPFEYWGDINLMKGALIFADKITTVSPTYADEICKSDEYGMGLQGVLSERREDLVGILNGVDYDIWSPQKDKLIPYNYIRQNLSNKKRNKLELLNRCHLPLRSEQPLIGMISRLDPQKGFDLLAKIMGDVIKLELQMVLLGTGLEEYHELFEAVEARYRDKFKAFLTFDNKLAHLIEAGADMFLMPSRYEPCGLNQMYSLKYGTVPIVRKTGGLADTVVDWNDETMTGTGFVFEGYDEKELLAAIKRALELFSRRRTWYKIVKQGMDQDFSWDTSAREYEALYESMRVVSNPSVHG